MLGKGKVSREEPATLGTVRHKISGFALERMMALILMAALKDADVVGRWAVSTVPNGQ
jgi:hypothetical protein